VKRRHDHPYADGHDDQHHWKIGQPSGMLMRGLRHRPMPAADTWKTRSCVRRS
jgi:hypothetical protein